MIRALALSCALVAGASPVAAEAAAPPSRSAEARRAADLAAIRQVGRDWQEAYIAGRFADIPELYTADTMVMPRGRPRIEGREGMRRSIGGLAAGRRVQIDVTEKEAFVAGDYGWFVGDFVVTYTPPDAATPPRTEHGRSLIIFRRDADGRWRVHRDMDSPAPHPPAAKIAAPTTPPGPVPAAWDPARRTTPTACDRMAASRYDRTRLAPPVARADMDVPKVIAQCEADLKANPGDPRILFQLGRVYGYAGDAGKTRATREAAAAAGNHNAVFLLGFLDWNAAKDDAARCTAARTMKLAADRGNYSAQLTYASFWLEGRFEMCADAASKAEVTGYVRAARPAVDGFFETRFADHLQSEIAHTPGN